ncbi:MAG: aminotransferase class V-fold PLP-dependent enzyme, partial [Gemmatimonadota bacterium]|nr:aminotransferase class V-fold PLP-dependent enzyme [Gemmatimonadota bacterium]
MSESMPSRRGFLRCLAAAGVTAPLLARAERIEASLNQRGLRSPFLPDHPEALRALRAQYLLSDDLTYLNHASIGTVPRAVHEAHTAYLELCESHPSLYVWGSVWREVLEDTRSSAAQLLGCRADDVAITHNTTEGFNVLAHGLPLAPGDEVLFSSLNHPGASVAWRALAERRGFTVRTFDFPVDRSSEMTVDEVVALHAAQVGPATRALVVPHVDNMIGMTHPLPELAVAVRARGVRWVLVDGAQSVGMIPVDLGTAGVDAYAASPHKWVQAPKGLGLFWASAALQSELPRMWFRTPGAGIESTARKYEDYSTRAWPAVVALGDALAFQASIGTAEKARRYAALWSRLQRRVSDEPGLTWRSPVEPRLRSVIMAVEVGGAHAPELGSRLLSEHGVVLRAFGTPLNTLRVSPNLSTSDEELDRFL